MVIKEKRPDLDWDVVMSAEYPYYLSKGRRRSYPKCRGCKTPITFQWMLRIQLDTYVVSNGHPLATTLTFCANKKCVEMAIRECNQKKEFLPPFKRLVHVPSSLHASHPELCRFSVLDLNVNDEIQKR